ncbi:hypothetical protein EDD22DRAFT_957259 [Suillus occidentalis]|nr:hypothetical protein EDD22DRAFT_957259 [Suillus occidentalis]
MPAPSLSRATPTRSVLVSTTSPRLVSQASRRSDSRLGMNASYYLNIDGYPPSHRRLAMDFFLRQLMVIPPSPQRHLAMDHLVLLIGCPLPTSSPSTSTSVGTYTTSASSSLTTTDCTGVLGLGINIASALISPPFYPSSFDSQCSLLQKQNEILDVGMGVSASWLCTLLATRAQPLLYGRVGGGISFRGCAELNKRRDKRLALACRKRVYEVVSTSKRRRTNEDVVWSWWKVRLMPILSLHITHIVFDDSTSVARDDSQTEIIAETNRKRHKLERERRAIERPQPHRIVFSSCLLRRIPNAIPDPLPAPTIRQIAQILPLTTSRRHILATAYPDLNALPQADALPFPWTASVCRTVVEPPSTFTICPIPCQKTLGEFPHHVPDPSLPVRHQYRTLGCAPCPRHSPSPSPCSSPITSSRPQTSRSSSIILPKGKPLKSSLKSSTYTLSIPTPPLEPQRNTRSRRPAAIVTSLGGDSTILFTSWLFQRIVPPALPFALGSLGFLTNFEFEKDSKRETLSRTSSSSMPNLGPNFNTPMHFYEMATAAGASPLTPFVAHNLPPDLQRRRFEQELENAIDEIRQAQSHQQDDDPAELEDDGDVDVDFNIPEDEEDDGTLIITQPNEDSPDPFTVEEGFPSMNDTDLASIPPHLLSIYAVVSWLHLQFHLPRIACNALLAVFACSSHRVLGVDTPTFTFLVFPSCRDVYPPAGSPHSHETYTSCKIDLFLPGLTKRGNQRPVKTPIVKYPYLPLSEQIKSMLKISGLEAVLDDWRCKPRSPGQYSDIFDGEVCRTKLKGPNGKPLFSNLPHEKNGPDGELWIGSIGSHIFGVILHRLTPHVQHHSLYVTFHQRIDVAHQTLSIPQFSTIFGSDRIMSSTPSMRCLLMFVREIAHKHRHALGEDPLLLTNGFFLPPVMGQSYACLPSDEDDQTLRNRVTMISKLDAEREAQAKGKANERKALEEARKRGKDAYTQYICRESSYSNVVDQIDRSAGFTGIILLRLVIKMPHIRRRPLLPNSFPIKIQRGIVFARTSSLKTTITNVSSSTMQTPSESTLRDPACNTCKTDGRQCTGRSDIPTCDGCRQNCSLLDAPYKKPRPFIMQAIALQHPGCAYCELCSHVVKDVKAPASTESDEIVLLDEKPADWEDLEPAPKRRKLKVESKRMRLQHEIMRLEHDMARMNEILRQAKESYKEMEHGLRHLKRCLADRL